jgi:serine/threonine protein kinase/ankyrin repeat protein
MASSLFLSSTVNLESSGSLVAAQIEGLSVEDDITTLPKFMTLAASVGLGGPQTLSTYNLDSNLFERIGEGAQFEVFRHYEWNEGNGDGDTTIKGYTRNTHKIYKRISRRLYKTKNKDSLRDLRLEVQVLAQDAVRAHPNIVDIVGWGYDHPRTMFEERREDQGRYPPNEPIPVLILGEAYCSMDRFFASNVFERAQSSSWSVRCNLALGVAAGLECLRGIGVLHNDLKPENILVCRQEDPDMPFISKLADFGLSVTSVDDFRKYGRTVGWKPPESLNYDKEEHGVCSRKALFRSESYVYGLVVLYIICVGSKTAESASRRYDGSFPQFRHDRWTREKETVELLKGQTTFSATDLEKARNCYSNLEHFFLGESPQDRSDVSPKLILGDDSTYQKWSAHFQKLTSATAKLIPFKKSDGFLTGLDFYRSLRPPILEDLRANLTETFPGDLLFSMAISSLIMRASKDHAYVRKLINMSASAKSPSLVGMGVVSAVNTAIPSDGSPCDPLVEKEYVWRALASGSRTAIRAAQSMGPDMIREAQAEFRSKGGYNKESRLFQEDTLARGNLRDQLAAAQRDWGTTDVPPLIGEMLKLRTGLLHVAAMLGDVDIIRALVEAKHKDVDETNLAGETPLYKACVAGQYEAARVLIELCADACVRVGPLQVTCLHWVFNFPSDKMELIARLLLSKGLSLDAKVLPQRAKNEPDWVESHHFPFHWPIGTPLHWSAHAESQDAVDVLLRCGADVDELDIADDDRAQTPLAMAVYRGSLEMATHLSNSRANAARIDGRGCSLLSFLVADDCLYNTLNPVPKILFQWCAQGSYDRALAATKSLVQMITSAGIDVDTPRKRGNTGEFVTPLQDAAINNNAVGIIALLEAGADAEVVETYSRRLPLHIWAGNDMRSLAYPQGYIPALEMLVSRTRSKMTRDLDGETFVHSALTGVDAQNGSDFELWKRKLQVLLAHCNGLSINDC